MRLLLDAHVLLWFAFNPGRIPGSVRASIENEVNTLLVSIATVWELAIKARTGKLPQLDGTDFREFIESYERRLGFNLLPIGREHAFATLTLPQLHKDPFDRILVAQSQVEGIPIVTAGRLIRRYPIETIW